MSQNGFPQASAQASTSSAPNTVTPASYHPLPRPRPLPSVSRVDTQGIKQELHDALGENGLPYWKAMNGYLLGQIGRQELEDMVRGWLKGSKVHLHNRLLVALLHNASTPTTQAIPSASLSRKRKRVPVDDPEFDVDETIIEPKSRIASWVSLLTNRDRGRLRRVIMGKSETAAEEEDPDEEWEAKRKKASSFTPNTWVPPECVRDRTLPSSVQASQRLAAVAQLHDLKVHPDSSDDIGQFLSVGVDDHLHEILHDIVRLTGRERPGEESILVPKGQQKNGYVNGDPPTSESHLPRPDIHTVAHIMNMHPNIQSGASPATYRLVSSQTLSELEAYQPIIVESQHETDERSTKVPNHLHLNGSGGGGGGPRGYGGHGNAALTKNLLESGLLKIDKAAEEGEGKKNKRHNLHWRYEDPALLLRDWLG